MSHVRLLNLRKRLREKLRLHRVEPDILALIQEIEAVSDELICVATRVKELRKDVGDAEWEGKDNLQALARELKYYEQLANDGVVYEPTF